uniref:Serine protease n=1 Tax=Blue fish point virus TaxID=2485865 RepID=A0A3G3BTD9_9VIRU|nr:hypothetical protein [Blue fish point virus]
MEMLTVAYLALWLMVTILFVMSYNGTNRFIYGALLSIITVKVAYITTLGLYAFLEDSLLSTWGYLKYYAFILRCYLGSNECMCWVKSEQGMIAMVAFLSVAYYLFTYLANRPMKRFGRSYVPEFVPEKMIPGNNFQLNAQMPKFQVEIYGSVDGTKFYPIGQGFWVEEYIVTAGHVIYDFTTVKLVRGENEVSVPTDHFVLRDGDLAVLPVQPGLTSKLQLSKGKLARQGATKDGGLMAQIVAFGQRSSGFINPYEQFGYCSYMGSTVKGFSGAPYYLNNTIFGMHLGGNNTNLGYEGSYIRSLLKPTAQIRGSGVSNEDSVDWLIEQADREVDLQYDRNPYEPDEYRVRIRGSYHIVDSETMDRIIGRGSATRRGPIQMDFEGMNEAEGLPLCPRNAMSFNDSGNLIRAPASAGARGQEQAPAAALPQNQQRSGQMVYQYQTPLAPSDMESQTLTRVQQSAVSRNTQRRRRARQNVRSPHPQNRAQPSSNVSNPIVVGQPVSPPQPPQTNGLRSNSPRPSVSWTTAAPQGTAA